VISKGNVKKNTNEYSLILFQASAVFRTSKPRVLVIFSSSSNREGIFDVRWSNDNDTLYFLGSRRNETTQLYSIQCNSGQLTRLTNHPTSVVSYSVSEQNNRIVYSAEKREIGLLNDNTSRHGIDVDNQSLSDLITLHSWDYGLEIFVGRLNHTSSKRLRTQNPFDSGVNDLYFSPNARYLVVKTDTTELPASWSQYTNEEIQVVLRRKPRKGIPTRLLRYELIDTETGISKVLLDSPATYAPADVLWSPDSNSLLLCGVFLPLNVDDSAELGLRKSSKFIVEIDLVHGTTTKLTKQDLIPLQWNRRTNIVQFSLRQSNRAATNLTEYVCYRKSGAEWSRRDCDPSHSARPEIIAEQDMNTPPRVVAIDLKKHERKALLDLNPGFEALAFGRVEKIDWTDKRGRTISGGLYLPPDFKAGVRYPLVIQTHGFDPQEFSMDGRYSTAFSARPLAGKAIVVLQVNDILYDSLVTRQEPENAMSVYENAVDLLDTKGIIDPARIGIIGFSRTCFYVKYTLTHSRLHFLAAIAADGVDAGYLQYLVFSNSNAQASDEVEAIIGKAPFGAGISRWLQQSPGFMLDKVDTPVLLQALDPSSILGEWEWFSGLRRLGKPVDLLYLPTGSHVLIQPWHRLASQGTALDWLCFWLKNEEDPAPDKREQYRHWEHFRDRVRDTVSMN
jgi:dipeptidyl aminopeptidase/acylaminoacyl peptidase